MAEERGYWSRLATDRRSRRRVLGQAVAGLASVSGLALIGCGSKKPQASVATRPAAPQPGGTFSTYDPANIGSLDPQRGQASSSSEVLDGVLSFLYRFKTSADPRTYLDYEPVGDLAVSAESPDGTTWTLKLQPNAKFAAISPVNGHAVEAEDIKATFMRAVKVPDNALLQTVSIVDPTQIQTPASDTVVFKLKTPFATFPSVLSSLGTEILPREALAGAYDPGKQVIGSGPFMLDSYTPDLAAVLKKNPQWFQSNRPYVDTVHVAIISDAAQQLAQFTGGHLDEVFPSPADFETVSRSNPKAQVLKSPSSGSYTIQGHQDHPSSPYADVHVRQALSMALDRAAIGKAAFNGDFSNNGPVMAGLGRWALAPDQLGDGSQYMAYNLEAVKKLVEQTPAAKSINQLMYPANYYGRPFDTMCETVNSMLNAAGIKTQLVPLDYVKDFNNSGKGVYFGNYPDTAILIAPMAIHGDAVATMEAAFLSSSSRGKQIKDPQLDDMLIKAQGILNEDDRLNAVHDLERYLAVNMLVVPLPSAIVYTLVQPWVQNYHYSGGVAMGAPGTWPEVWINH